MAAQQPPEAPGRFPSGCLALFALPFVLLAFVLLDNDDDTDPDNPLVQQVDAERYCKDEVTARLKAPGTAEFVDVDASGLGPFIVTGAVDSENSFGATLRSTFRCTVTLVGDQWRLDDLDLVDGGR